MNKTFIGVVLVALLVLSVAVLAKPPKPDPEPTTQPPRVIPWLGFHDVVAGAHEATSDINVSFLNEWTQFLADKGYTTLTQDELYSYLSGTNTTGLPAKVVVISFDDNYEGTCQYAYPRLNSLGLKATNFVHTNYVGVMTSKDHCDWSELAMMEGVISAESHTKNHVDLTVQDAATRWEEIAGSKAALEANLPKTVNYFAYPYGKTNADVISDLQAAGYLMAALYNNKVANTSSPVFEVPRLQMGSTDTMATFMQKIGYAPNMHVEDIAMSSGSSGVNKFAVASVTIRDDSELLVEGATVSVQWSGLVSGSGQGITNAEGVAVIQSPNTKKSGTVVVTVTNVVKGGAGYDSAANVETSDSIVI